MLPVLILNILKCVCNGTQVQQAPCSLRSSHLCLCRSAGAASKQPAQKVCHIHWLPVRAALPRLLPGSRNRRTARGEGKRGSGVAGVLCSCPCMLMLVRHLPAYWL